MPKKQKGGSSCGSIDLDLNSFKSMGSKLSQSEDAFSSRMTGGKKGGAYYLGVQNQKIGGLAEVIRVDDPIPPTISHSTSSNYPNPLYLQKGTGLLFNHIVNPITNRKVKVDSPLGKKIVAEYSRVAFSNKQRGGAKGVFTGNMLERTFDGKQPEWKPSDI